MNDPECCRLLMYYADLNLKDQKGRTALDIAASMADDPTCELLLGCNPIPSTTKGVQFAQEVSDQIENEKAALLADWEIRIHSSGQHYLQFLDDVIRVTRRLNRFYQLVALRVRMYERRLKQFEKKMSVNEGDPDINALSKILLSTWTKRIQESKDLQKKLLPQMYSANGNEALQTWSDATKKREQFMKELLLMANKESKGFIEVMAESGDLSTLKNMQGKKRVEQFQRKIAELCDKEITDPEVTKRIEVLNQLAGIRASK
ncbi:hypothetical protein GPJ56_004349 [Histomonas meleagridis]|uniref:uncharacterized protein n=1 Tax=Histomonas meleagridis TaxID=135588 RepID=UPI0035598F5A|nr:hypothetical protein GPJ56_004349 [Histomonas meleagridis]KAH0800006.1 hypothetical protein GO595_007118 [Histomonas meleagridis]